MSKPIDKAKLKQKLEKTLGRISSVNEQINAEKDALLLLQVLTDRVDDLEDRVTNLENK